MFDRLRSSVHVVGYQPAHFVGVTTGQVHDLHEPGDDSGVCKSSHWLMQDALLILYHLHIALGCPTCDATSTTPLTPRVEAPHCRG